MLHSKSTSYLEFFGENIKGEVPMVHQIPKNDIFISENYIVVVTLMINGIVPTVGTFRKRPILCNAPQGGNSIGYLAA